MGGSYGPWCSARYAQHQARFPPEEKALRNRERQARFRANYADDRAKARAVANILGRRSGFSVADLAAAIRDCLGDDGARELGRALVSAGRRRPASRRGPRGIRPEPGGRRG
jgi:hypothetical protein